MGFRGQAGNFAIQRTQPTGSRTQRMVAIRLLSHRLDRTTIEHRDWEHILDTHDAPATLLFPDPPCPDSGANNHNGWSTGEPRRFREPARSPRGKWPFTFQDRAEAPGLMQCRRARPVDRARGIDNKDGPAKPCQEVVITPRQPRPACPLQRPNTAPRARCKAFLRKPQTGPIPPKSYQTFVTSLSNLAACYNERARKAA